MGTAALLEAVGKLIAATRTKLSGGRLEHEYATLEELGPAPGVLVVYRKSRKSYRLHPLRRWSIVMITQGTC